MSDEQVSSLKHAVAPKLSSRAHFIQLRKEEFVREDVQSGVKQTENLAFGPARSIFLVQVEP